MTVETFVPPTSVITLTDAAVKHFEKKLKHHEDKIVRLSTKVSGCTGYAYVLDFADDAREGDQVININPTLTVAISKDAVPLIKNTEIDYVMEGVNGVIKYNNPNVVDECGCGESFNIS
jgi:iron-sulfur cluster assembly protein